MRREELSGPPAYYDSNVRGDKARSEVIRYIHHNPVKRGLVEKPEDWSWSSFRHYATGEKGSVEIELQWTAFGRGNRLPEGVQMKQVRGKHPPPAHRKMRNERGTALLLCSG